MKFIAFLLPLLLVACSSRKHVKFQNESKLYHPDLSPSSIFCQAYIDEDKHPYMSVGLHSEDFNPELRNHERHYSIKVVSTVYQNDSSMSVVDTISHDYSLHLKESQDTTWLFNNLIKCEAGKRYVIKTLITDKTNKKIYKKLSYLDFSSGYTRNNFRLYDHRGDLLMHSFINSDRMYRLHFMHKPATYLTVKVYHQRSKVPAPPFDITGPPKFEHEPDSIYKISQNAQGQFEFKPTHSDCFYFIQADTAQKAGFTLYAYNRSFPFVRNINDMLATLRYLHTQREFNDLIRTSEPKQTLDDYWLQTAGNQERAQKVIRNYYKRVERANTYFTSYKEGWKTDMGMIYIIYGPPQKIYFTNNGQTWFYGDENNINTLTFNFIRINNPYSDKAFALYRDGSYKTPGTDKWDCGAMDTRLSSGKNGNYAYLKGMLTFGHCL